MATTKFNFVVEAVRYSKNGELEKARLYERRGSSYSDIVIHTRADLIKALQAGKTIMAGKRQHRLASTFENIGVLRLSGSKDKPVFVFGEDVAEKDTLPGVPLF